MESNKRKDRFKETSPLLQDTSLNEIHSSTSSTSKCRWIGILVFCIIIGIVAYLAALISYASHDSYNSYLDDQKSFHFMKRPLTRYHPPYKSRSHPILPKMISKNVNGPYPTNEWWTNLLISDSQGLNTGAGPVTVVPYTIQSTLNGLQVSYGDTRRMVTNTSIMEVFNSDLILSSNSSIESKEVIDFDALSVKIQFNTSTDGYFKIPLFRGSPYITAYYNSLFPSISINGSIISIKTYNTQWNPQNLSSNSLIQGKRFEIISEVAGGNQQWIIYCNESITFLPLQQKNSTKIFGLQSQNVYTGMIRAAIVPKIKGKSENNKLIYLLNKHSSVYPIAAELNYGAKNDTGIIQFSWETKCYCNLLMLANPHQADTFVSNHSMESVGNLGYRTLKGYMTGVIGNTWIMHETLTKIGFNAPRNITNPLYIKKIKEALLIDSNYSPKAIDPYFFGKEIARQARLVLIADELNEIRLRDELLHKIMKWIRPWFEGENQDYFQYDRVWGGICTKNGLDGVFYMTDFGNGWYSDHHFHYGYFIYTAAVIGKFKPNFVFYYYEPIISMIRDIANPSTEDPYFPLTRYFSWFDGHSFASGIFVLDGGKSQESVSEAINAYYSMYLLGKVLKMDQVKNFGRLLLAMEMRAAQTYWQMPSKSSIYEPEYAINKMTGQVASTKTVYVTWFGTTTEDMHLINMIPFTPITEEFLKKDYIQEEYDVLETYGLERQTLPLITDQWKGYAYLDHAILNPFIAWNQILNITTFDDGNSKTNSLYWIATRPLN